MVFPRFLSSGPYFLFTWYWHTLWRLLLINFHCFSIGFYHRAPTFHLHGIDILYEDCYSINFHGFSVVFIIGPPFEIYKVFPLSMQLQKCQVISKLFTVFLHNNFLQTFYIVLLLSVSVPINLHDHCKDVNLKTRVFTVIIDLHDM
jgi:hypothetical protein